ncbi:sensor protein ZraS [bacterium BMS3Abin01]|nr:sensor protein ZraS [bacterium BMS3Abin01]
MSLRKKIIVSFFISAFIVALLAVFVYVNFVSIRNEMRFLEVADSIRNRALQLRRHEKNFFLFKENAEEESDATRDYIGQLYDVTEEARSRKPDRTAALEELIARYEGQFTVVETGLSRVSQQLGELEAESSAYEAAMPLVEATVRDKPAVVATFLQEQLSLADDHPLIVQLKQLDADIGLLRNTGEEIVVISNEFDRDARSNAENGIRQSQVAILVFVPLFLAIGLGTLLFISTGVVRRLKMLTASVEEIGEHFVHGAAPVRGAGGHMDEVDILVEKTRIMNDQLIDWEQELEDKNLELIRSQKLAAIGTLASGVAHELNNPLNNINISAQVLKKQMSATASRKEMETLDDIIGQTLRVRGIVGDLLEFAREREPQLRETDLVSLVGSAYDQASRTMDTDGIDFAVDCEGEVRLSADPNQLERVFINLFANAIVAMKGKGALVVKIEHNSGMVNIWVSDKGKGMSPEDQEKIFDPFFTNREKGTGLGLAIVMNIIRQHGGDISVVSEEGMGTVFEIHLPGEAG